jgi:hypothetical protein
LAWRQLEVVRTGTRMYMTVDLQNTLEQSASSVPVNLTDSYYIEVKTTGNNMLEVRDLSVGRSSTTGTTDPITVTSSLTISPSNVNLVGQSVTGKFTVKNTSTQTVTLSRLLIGGRLNGQCPNSVCPDFAPVITNLTLAPGISKIYDGYYQFVKEGHYDFFVSYLASGSSTWVTSLPVAYAGQVSSRTYDIVQAPTTPTISDLALLGTPINNTSFNASLVGTEFISGQTQVFAFCDTSCANGCRHPATGIKVTDSQHLNLTAIKLLAGSCYLKARNTDLGSWSNPSQSFTVAPALPLGNAGELFTLPLYSDASLLAYYRFEGNSTDSKGVYHGSATSVAYGTTYGKFGQGASFNGSSSYISYGTGPALTNQMTISLWVKPTGAGARNLLVKAGDGGYWESGDYQLQIGSDNVLGFWVNTDNGGTGILAYATGPIANDSWHHVVGVVDKANNTIRLYIDGVLQSGGGPSMGNRNIRATNRQMYLGKQNFNNVNGLFMNGTIDDMAVFSRALSASEISALYAGGSSSTTGTINLTRTGYTGNVSCTLNGTAVTVPATLTAKPAGSYTLACTAPTGYTISSITPSATQTLSGGGTVSFGVTLSATVSTAELYASTLFSDPSLVSYWRMEGNANDAKNLNNGTASSITFSTTNGKFGSGGSFNGTNSIITIPDSASLDFGAGSVTLVAWIKSVSGSADNSDRQIIWASTTNLGTLAYSMGLENWGYVFARAGSLQSNMANQSGYGDTISNPAMLDDGAWHHVAFTYSNANGVGTIYIDGAVAATKTIGSGKDLSVAAPVIIGGRPDGNSYFSGSLDDVAIFSRALTAAEITGLYAGGSSSTTGTINLTRTGYTGNVSCTLNGTAVTVPATLTAKPAGSYTLACTAPTGYTISSITPSATQTLSGGGTVSFGVDLASTASFTFNTLGASKTVQAGQSVGYDLNLTPTNNFTGQVNVLYSGLPANTSVVNPSLQFSIGPTNGATFTLTLQTTGGTPAGTYTINLTAQGGGVTKTLSLTLTITACRALCQLLPVAESR